MKKIKNKTTNNPPDIPNEADKL
jgi:hypothetical protein